MRQRKKLHPYYSRCVILDGSLMLRHRANISSHVFSSNIFAIYYQFKKPDNSKVNQGASASVFLETDGKATPLPQSANDFLSYKVLQTIKGSSSLLGPLQCESTCEMKLPPKDCTRPIPDCAIQCASKCAEHANTAVGFGNKMCMYGCGLFCDMI